MAEEKATYKNSGVDLSIYATSMEKIPGIVSKTFTPRVMRLDGGFAGLCDRANHPVTAFHLFG